MAAGPINWLCLQSPLVVLPACYTSFTIEIHLHCLCHRCALSDISVLYRARTEASDFNAALYEHAQYLRRKKEAQERRQAYESTAGHDELGASSSSQSELSLKPGETITLKLAKVSHAFQPVWLFHVLQLEWCMLGEDGYHFWWRLTATQMTGNVIVPMENCLFDDMRELSY